MLPDLKPYLAGSVVVIGIGNRLRSDDGAGSLIAGALKDRFPGASVRTVIDAGVTPENYAGKIIAQKPASVIIIDAVSFGGAPGEIRMFDAAGIQTTNFFATHNASLSLFIGYLRDNLRADMVILAIQPGTIVFGESLSPEVAQAARRIEEWLA